MNRQTLTDKQVKILLSRCSSVSEERAQSYRHLLSQEELEKNQSYRFARDQHRDLIARALIRVTLAEVLGQEPDSIVIVVDEKGKPHLQSEQQVGVPAVYFNLTHSGDWVLLAIAKAKVGIDVEHTERKNDVLAIADRYFFGPELAELLAYPEADQKERFFDYWTLKEAYIKARGEGISLGLSNFGFCLKNGIQLHVEPVIGDDPLKWQFCCLTPEPDYRVSIALESSDTPDYVFDEVVPLVDKKPLAWLK